MKFLIFFIPLYLCKDQEKPDWIPECNEIQKRKCEKRRGFRCFGDWKGIIKRGWVRWKRKFECRKPCCKRNRKCNKFGTEYIFTEFVKNRLRRQQTCECKLGWTTESCAQYNTRAEKPDFQSSSSSEISSEGIGFSHELLTANTSIHDLDSATSSDSSDLSNSRDSDQPDFGSSSSSEISSERIGFSQKLLSRISTIHDMDLASSSDSSDYRNSWKTYDYSYSSYRSDSSDSNADEYEK